MKFLVINGPNLNLLGLREPAIYGSRSFAALQDFIRASAADAGVEVFDLQHGGGFRGAGRGPPVKRMRLRGAGAGGQPTEPSSDTASSALASRANSIGSSSSTAWQKPPTMRAVASSGSMPRCWQ